MIHFILFPFVVVKIVTFDFDCIVVATGSKPSLVVVISTVEIVVVVEARLLETQYPPFTLFS